MVDWAEVRLVVWDLDETFWKGTLTEGGVERFLPRHHELVRRLARRGILSSICSKNDFEAVKRILVAQGLWEFFVFPSIDWSPKAPRILQLIEDVQLRAPTVLFIDDNPGNLAEVAALAPGVQVAGPDVIDTLWAYADRLGKDDFAMSRLQQYKLLERRTSDRAKAPGDVAGFLRQSNIRVTIEADVEGNLDRAIELIKRTNQLNFTKRQLPDDPTEARKALLAELGQFHCQAGLVRVSDNYGDYGFVGFYMMLALHGHCNTVHFCFSCRTLGMGVERWVYNEIGRPPFRVVGEVVADLDDQTPIDWINHDGYAAGGETLAAVDDLRFRGGCEFDAVTHYFRAHSGELAVETNRVRNGLLIRGDSSANLTLTLSGALDRRPDLFADLWLGEDDLRSRCFAAPTPQTTLVLSTWGDLVSRNYRREDGASLDFMFQTFDLARDLTQMTDEEFASYDAKMALDPKVKAKLERVRKALAANYASSLGAPLEEVKTRMRAFARAVAPGRLIVALPSERRRERGSLVVVERARAYNSAVREALADCDNATVIGVDECVEREAEILDYWLHYHRIVYFRLYRRIVSLIGAARGERLAVA